jgi:hypothetical protein
VVQYAVAHGSEAGVNCMTGRGGAKMRLLGGDPSCKKGGHDLWADVLLCFYCDSRLGVHCLPQGLSRACSA